MSQPQPSNSDPTPHERTSDSAFLPVVIAFAVALIVILIAAIVFLKVRQTKAIPNPKAPHPTSQIMPASPSRQPLNTVQLG